METGPNVTAKNIIRVVAINTGNPGNPKAYLHTIGIVPDGIIVEPGIVHTNGAPPEITDNIIRIKVILDIKIHHRFLDVSKLA